MLSFCVGYSDLSSRTPCTAEHFFGYGSTTKTHLVVLLLQMAEQGLFDLDDSITEHANAYLRLISNGTSDLIDLYGPMIEQVTIRQLMQMTAGLQVSAHI